MSSQQDSFTEDTLMSLLCNGTSSNLQMLHQKSVLEFEYLRSSGTMPTGGGESPVISVLQKPHVSKDYSWICNGKTILYLIDHSEQANDTNYHSLGIHFRPTHSCQVENVQVFTSTNNNLVPLSQIRHAQIDPLSKILRSSSTNKYEADAHMFRGGSGFATSLRAAGVAATDGEFKIAFSLLNPTDDDNTSAKCTINKELWKKDLVQDLPVSCHLQQQQHAIQEKLHSRTFTRRNQRLDLVSNMLTKASNNKKKQLPLKIIIHWKLKASSKPFAAASAGGLCFLSSPSTPHAYTTNAGARSWLPCIDTTFVYGRSSHEMFLSITADQSEGLSLVSSGETFVQDVILENNTTNKATHMVASCTYEAISCRCLGFAIGPFQILVDPECLELSNTSTQSNAISKKRKKKSKEPQRKQGIIRQAFFAPVPMRPRLHFENYKNLHHCYYNVVEEEEEENNADKQLYDALSSTITYSTSGVALRALHFCSALLIAGGGRQFCSVYTQIWIPNAIDGGYAVGAAHQSSTHNSFVGGCILDTRLLPPIKKKLPFYHGGRALQMAQARNIVWMWLKIGISIGSDVANLTAAGNTDGDDVDEVGDGYILEVFYQYIMHLYEQAFGATGEGGSCHSMFYTERYADNVDQRYPSIVESLLGLENIEEDDSDSKLVAGGGGTSEVIIVQTSAFGPTADEDSSQSLYRNVHPSWSESRTSAADEATFRSILTCDVVESLHNRSTTMADKYPVPSMGWSAIGSLLSLTFLASQTTNATRCGCGVVDATHSTQLMYREAKAWWVAKIAAARAGPENFMRTIRACFLAGALYSSHGWTCLPPDITENSTGDSVTPRFLLIVDEFLKRGGISHILFTKSLRLLAGSSREVYLNGFLVDIGKEVLDVNGNQSVIPEGFPNSYIRGASTLLLRVGVHVERVGTTDVTGTSSQPKGTHLHINAEAAIPADGIVFGGPIHVRIVENENTCREFVRTLNLNNTLSQWGPIQLYSKPVTSAKSQLAAISHTSIEGASGSVPRAVSSVNPSVNKPGASNSKPAPAVSVTERKSTTSTREDTAPFKQKSYSVFTDDMLHSGGYQALELVRFTNRTPLLWCSVDPGGFYGGRIAINQPDACWGEMLFHDVNASGQIEAIRALAEKPSRIQGNVNDVNVAELPVRLLGDCLRGSAALHSSIPHSPTIRAQAALAIAQWQNNKAPPSKDAVGASSWIGLNLLIQYFRERFTCSNIDGSITILPCKYTRETIQKAEGGDYLYLDEVDKDDQDEYLPEARIEVEEDEEYRIRSAVITAISCIRAKDGQTPPQVIEFLEMLLPVCDGAAFSSTSTDAIGNRTMQQSNEALSVSACEVPDIFAATPELVASLSFVDPILVANSLLSLCNVNVRPARSVDLNDDVVMSNASIEEYSRQGSDVNFADGACVNALQQSSTVPVVAGKFSQLEPMHHPIQRLLNVCRLWLDWALYQEATSLRFDAESQTGIGIGFFSIIPSSAITSLCSISLLKQCTSSSHAELSVMKLGSARDSLDEDIDMDLDSRIEKTNSGKSTSCDELEEGASAQFYINIFDDKPTRSDTTRAAAAQAVTCVCCAADRLKASNEEAVGLLTALEFLLDGILDFSTVSPALRQTLGLLMMDACTGKVCSTQRVATLGGRNDVPIDVSRFSCGPLGSTFGGDIGASILLTVSDELSPAANAVNDGARVGLRFLTRCGLDSSSSDETVIRVAKFATKLWRVMNGEDAGAVDMGFEGICSYDPILRTTLLSLWQWIFPKGCIAIIRVQSWRSIKGESSELQKHFAVSTNDVMSVSEEDKKRSTEEDSALSDIQNVVSKEIARQQWRCDMSSEAYELMRLETINDPAATLGGVGQPLPVLNKDISWRNGAWVASTALQRRDKGLDGGTSVTKLRLNVPTKSGND